MAMNQQPNSPFLSWATFGHFITNCVSKSNFLDYRQCLGMENGLELQYRWETSGEEGSVIFDISYWHLWVVTVLNPSPPRIFLHKYYNLKFPPYTLKHSTLKLPQGYFSQGYQPSFGQNQLWSCGWFTLFSFKIHPNYRIPDIQLRLSAPHPWSSLNFQNTFTWKDRISRMKLAQYNNTP